jgi:hypothetical protein
MPATPYTRQHFFLEGRLLGETIRGGPRDLNRNGDGPLGYAFFCPHPSCGRVWALAPVAGRDFQTWTRLCGRHARTDAGRGTTLGPAGSLWLTWDEGWQNALPLDVLRREVELHCNMIEDLQGNL